MMITLFAVFAFLAVFNAGTMTALQIQHYGIYPQVGAEHFASYMRANNRAAIVPTVLPAVLLLATSAFLVIARPSFMSAGEAVLALALNVAQLVSTFVWQRRLHTEMAETGYDAAKARLLSSTNWIRTVAFLTQALLATMVVTRVLGRLS